MNIRMEVVRFRTEDVIATSGLCQNFGGHLYVTEAVLTENDNGVPVIMYNGKEYLYTAENGLEFLSNCHGGYPLSEEAIAAGFVSLEAGKWYYMSNGSPWNGVLCELQDHGQ